MYKLTIGSSIKKMTVNELRYFIYESYYKRIGFIKKSSYSMKGLKKKDLLLLATKLIKKIADCSNAKEYYKCYLKRQNSKSVKRSEIITYHSKTIKNSNVVDIRSDCRARKSFT